MSVNLWLVFPAACPKAQSTLERSAQPVNLYGRVSPWQLNVALRDQTVMDRTARNGLVGLHKQLEECDLQTILDSIPSAAVVNRVWRN